MRRPLIAGNWKMNLGREQAKALLAALLPQISAVADRDIVVAPMAPLVAEVAGAVAGTPVAVAAQNCHDQKDGAFTGEWPAWLLKELGCGYVIVGHSERRAIFHEDDAFVGRKTAVAFANGLTPIACIGETLEERESGVTFDVVKRQTLAILTAVQTADLPRLVLAYEPVWAIGTGRTATPAQAQEVHAFLRGLLAEHGGADVAAAVRILYGGSVKPDNIDELMAQTDIDGALVGGASLKADGFARLVNFIAR